MTELKYRIDIESFDHLAAKELHLNEIAFVNIATAEPISFDPYEENRDTGGFILIDRHTNATVGAGMIRFGLRRAANTYFQAFEVTKSARARLNAQKPALLWFTGLSGAGKSTIANNLEKKLHAFGKHTSCSTVIMSAMGSIAIWVSPKATASRIFAALRKWRSCSSRLA